MIHLGHHQNINPFSAKPTKWPNTLKQFVGKLPRNCLSVFDQFVGLALEGLKNVHLSHYRKGVSCRSQLKTDYCNFITFFYPVDIDLCFVCPRSYFKFY